jgi:hypothetical protein
MNSNGGNMHIGRRHSGRSPKMSIKTLIVLTGFMVWAIGVQASSLTVTNSSFEADVYGDNSFGAAQGWTFTSGGSANPVNDIFPGTTGSPGTMPSPADGTQGGYVGGGTGGNGFQDLPATYAANTTYTLTVAVGHRLDVATIGNYQVSLFAGSGTNLVSASGSSSAITSGTFSNVTVSVTTATGDAFLGQPIRVWIRDIGYQTYFDNVRVDATAGSRIRPSVNNRLLVLNSSFETTALADNDFTLTAPDGWTGSGQVGLSEPVDAMYPNSSAAAGKGLLPGTGDGAVFARIRTGGWLSQTLNEVVQSGTYTLTFALGNRLDDAMGTNVVKLLAGATVLTNITVDAETAIANGTFQDFSVGYTTSGGPVMGQALTVRVESGGGGLTGEVNFDNVRLDFLPSRKGSVISFQ